MKKVMFDTQYVSQKNGYSLEKRAFVNKKLCGCGVTTHVLKNSENVIVLMPTIGLIENKVAQMDGLLGVNSTVEDSEIEKYVESASPIKICCTYDSLYRLEGYLNKIDHLIFDESDSFFLKYADKTDVNGRNLYRKALEIAEKIYYKVTFVSATPIPVMYMPEWIKELDQIEYEFKNTFTKKPMLMKRQFPVVALMKEIIMPIKENGFVELNGKKHTKLCIFMNSVNTVMQKVIPSCNLTPDEVGFYIGTSINNDIKLNNKYERITGLNDLKKFNFITSTGYSGMDIYDDNVLTVVVSYVNKEKPFMIVDVNTQLKQAVSRVRNDSNSHYLFIYNEDISELEEKELQDKLFAQYDLIKRTVYQANLWKNNADADSLIYHAFKNKDMLMFTDYKDGEYIVDELAFSVKLYAILETAHTFVKGCDLTISKTTVDEAAIIIKEKRGKRLMSYERVLDDIKNNNITDEIRISKWYSIIMKYNELTGGYCNKSTVCEEYVNAHTISTKLRIRVREEIDIEGYYTKKTLKNILQDIYNKENFKRNAKATDIYEFAEVENVRIGTIDRVKALKIKRWK